jgi:hypothetical protein
MVRAAVDFGFLDPLAQRLRGAVDLRGNRTDRRPARRMFGFVIQNHPDRRGTDFRRNFVRRLTHHGSNLSEVGASGKPGAVQKLMNNPPAGEFERDFRLATDLASGGYIKMSSCPSC